MTASPSSRPLRATYRLQMRKEFALPDAERRAAYLARLGISHVYFSPVLAARAGSAHGYDVVDHSRVNPELGGDRAWRSAIDEVHARDLGVVLDIVPNHMGVAPTNAAWEDVLAAGRGSRFAHWFDIDWDAPPPTGGRVLIATLADEPAAMIERGELILARRGGQLRIAHGDASYPLRAESVAAIAASARAEGGLLDGGLPDDAALRRFVEGEAGRQRLLALLSEQHYRLVHWRRASRDLNYRRFFDINDLVALRVEDERVFRATHAVPLRWVADGDVDALRIDHVDGLADPFAYLQRLRGEVGDGTPILVEKILSDGEQLRDNWPVTGTTGYEFMNDLEDLFLDPVGAAAIERGYRTLVHIGRRGLSFRDVAYQGKVTLLRTSLSPDVRRLARLLAPIARANPATAGLARTELVEGIIQLSARLPVYRTYIAADGEKATVSEEDRALVAGTIARIRETNDVAPRLLELFERLLLLADWPALSREGRQSAAAFVTRWQQTTGPATAKGVEDTALYLYLPIVSRNEVGGNPGRSLADAGKRLHAANAERARRWPAALLSTNTHDTKRSADVRARLDVLSEIPGEWMQAVRRWRRAHAPLRAKIGGRVAPDANMEFLLYQTLLGIWPFTGEHHPEPSAERLGVLRGRVEAYMLKAVREAKTRTSWTDPDDGYESALRAFLAALTDPADSARFVSEMSALAQRVAPAGMWNALARTLVHLTAPGTPDLYQGDELWHFALVDPDNRRPVDFAERERLLAALPESPTEDELGALVESAHDGRVKLHVTAGALRARRAHAAALVGGAYLPLAAEGPLASHLFAFARIPPPQGRPARPVVTVVPRLPYALAQGGPPTAAAWGETVVRLPEALSGHRDWALVLGGAAVRVHEISGGVGLRARDALAALPVALLAGG